MGVIQDDWQAGLSRAILAKREDGLYAAGIGGVVLSTCRQVGKTFTIGTLIFALCILNPGTKVLWSSHHSDTTGETLKALEGITALPGIAPFIAYVHTGNSDQGIGFNNGSVIKFGARERGFGRGVPGVSIVVFDEAQILGHKALNAMIPAANTIRNPLILFMGTPPQPEDNSEVFKGYRRDALAAKAKIAAGEDIVINRLYVEIGADDNPDPDSRVQWRKGNPSYPKRTPEHAFYRLRALLPDEASFVREGLGVWDQDQEGSRLVTVDEWLATEVAQVPQDGLRALGVAFSLDGDRVSLAGAIRTGQHHAHAELIDGVDGALIRGIEPLAEWIAQRKSSVAEVAIAGKSGATSLHLALRRRKFPERMIRVMTGPEVFGASEMLYNAIRGKQITHPVAPENDRLNRSAAISDRRFRGRDGAWVWDPTTPDGDETPMEAISFAYWMLQTTKRRPARTTYAGGMT